MNWKELHLSINDFAKRSSITIEESNTSHIGGKVTIYRLSQTPDTFYEIKHLKPIQEYGSKLRIYSKTYKNISIKVTQNLFGGTSMKCNKELPDSLNELLEELAFKIGSFQWVTSPFKFEWPIELQGTDVLMFESKQLELAVQCLDEIRRIHELLKGKP